jgi:O-antigen ligase
MILRLLAFFIYLLVAFFPAGLLLRIKIIPTVQVVPQDFIVVVICSLVLVYMVKNRTIGRFRNFYIGQILFLSVGLVSLVINFLIHSDLSIVPSVLYALRYFFYLHLIVAMGFLINLDLLRRLLLIAGGVFIVIGFIQFTFFNSLRPLFHLGWDDHLYRLFSTFLDPNFAGLFIAMYLFILMKDVIVYSFRSSYLQLLSVFYSGLAIMLTYSRTALVAMVSGLVILGVLKRKFVLLLASLVLVVLVLVTVSDVTVEGLNPFRTQSTSERIKSMREAATIFVDSPVFGSGFNAYRYVLVRNGYRQPEGAAQSNADAGTDNSYLFILATTGLIGFSIFIYSYIMFFRGIFTRAGKSKMLFISYCAVFMVGSLFVNALFYMPLLTWFFLSFSFFMEDKI